MFAVLPFVLFFGIMGAALADAIRIERDTVIVLNLAADAETVYVANPEIIDATPVALRKLFLLGKQAGETNIIVLDDEGREILHESAVVVPQAKRTVTLNKGVEETTLSCAPRCVTLNIDRRAKPPQAAAGPALPTAPVAAAAPAADAPAAPPISAEDLQRLYTLPTPGP